MAGYFRVFCRVGFFIFCGTKPFEIGEPRPRKIVVTVLGIRGDRVRLGIEAPLEIPVHRQEVYEKMQNQRF